MVAVILLEIIPETTEEFMEQDIWTVIQSTRSAFLKCSSQ